MKFFVKIVLLLCVFVCSCCEKKKFSDSTPGYRLIKRFSEKLNEETGIILTCYGTSMHQTEENILRYGKRMFSVSYDIIESCDPVISIEEARCTVVSIVESFLNAINTDPELREVLDVYPVTYDWIELGLHFVDENREDLKNGGIATIYCGEGNVKYETVATPIEKGSKRRDSTNYVEPYAEALEIVKRQGCLNRYYGSCLDKY